MNLVIFLYWAGPVPHLEFLLGGTSEKTHPVVLMNAVLVVNVVLVVNEVLVLCGVFVPFTVCLGFGLGLAPPLCSCKAFVPLSSIKMTLVMKIVGIVMAGVIIMMASMVTKDTNTAPDSTRTSREVKSSCRS